MTDKRRRVPVSGEPDVARAVVEASRLARRGGFSESDTNRLATAVSELARNIIKYAGTGDVLIGVISDSGRSGIEVLIGVISDSGRSGIEVVVRDDGPGIANLRKALEDHYSTSGTLGLGLPGVKRMMDNFEIESEPGKGTVVTIRMWRQSVRPKTNPMLRRTAVLREDRRRRTRGWGGVLRGEDGREDVECAYFTRPCLGERVNGDGLLLERRGELVFVALVDGLGHGREAHKVASGAVTRLRGNWPPDVSEAMHDLNALLTGSIGAAVGLALLDLSVRELRFVGIGNTVVRSMGQRARRLMSVEGNLGTKLRTLKEQRVRLGTEELVLFYTDGVRDRFELEDYPQMRYEAAKTVAQTVVERFGRSHDDATCIALRCLA